MEYEIREVWSPRPSIDLPEDSIVLEYEHTPKKELSGSVYEPECWHFIYLEPKKED